MDTIFLLGQESRQRILHRAAASLPGCAYLSVWARVADAAGLQHNPPPSGGAAAARLLYCLDAWLSGGDDDSGGGGGVVRGLFDAYRGSVCAAVTGCVPGWAHVDGGGAYMELSELDLAASASLPVQHSFYQEAGIKMAAFMGCESGEIEVGFSTAPAENYGGGSSLQASVEQVFSEDFFQQSLLEELLQLPPTRPSSSSSSLVGSPADGASTSLLRTMTPVMASSSATPSPRDLAVQVATTTTTPSSSRLHPRPPPHHVSPFSRHGGGGGGVLHFPSAEADDAAMAQAMLDVISSPSTSSSAAALHAPWSSSVKHRAQIRSPRRGTTTAFLAYNAALAPRAAALRRTPGAPGQRMIKMGFSILRRMHMVRCSQERAAAAAASAAAAQRGGDDEEDATAAPPPPTSSQLHHMISERRRRERLNESFEHLRGLLPPGSKKDKATVLAKTLEYMNLLIAQISELEAKNRTLQTQIHQRANGSSSSSMIRTVNEVHHQWLTAAAAGGGGSPERVQVHVIRGGDGTSTSPEVTVRVEVRASEGGADVSELVLRVLALLKGMGGFTVVAIDARQPSGGGNGVAQASLTLRATR
uniref:BHLH domain-containing protein n=1 Tax=Oryza punctata TaxID=4537 RepID=A0A0E0JXF6_ORYPU